MLSKLNVLPTQLELPQLSYMDVVFIHRLSSRKDKTPGVICRFERQADRNTWWESRKKLRDSCDTLFLLKHLARRSRSILLETKAWDKSNNYKYAWYSNGRVLVRKSDGSRAAAISKIADLDKLRYEMSNRLSMATTASELYLLPNSLERRLGKPFLRSFKYFHLNIRTKKIKNPIFVFCLIILGCNLMQGQLTKQMSFVCHRTIPFI